MYHIAHVSDLHVSPLPKVPGRLLLSKRILGYLSWHRRRKAEHHMDVLEALGKDLESDPPDHICVTGDLTNIALPGEFETARRYLDRLGPPEKVSVIPGNHDAYVAGALEKGTPLWAPFMRGDDGAPGHPWLRRRGPLAIIGCSSAVATAPAMASGRLGAEQISKLGQILTDEGKAGRFRLVLVHHPPQEGAEPWRKALHDRKAFRDVLLAAGAELVLHGHMHVPVKAAIEDGKRSIPILGAGSASLAKGRKGPAHYYRIAIGERTKGWHMEVESRHFDATLGRFLSGESRPLMT